MDVSFKYFCYNVIKEIIQSRRSCGTLKKKGGKTEILSSDYKNMVDDSREFHEKRGMVSLAYQTIEACSPAAAVRRKIRNENFIKIKEVHIMKLWIEMDSATSMQKCASTRLV